VKPHTPEPGRSDTSGLRLPLTGIGDYLGK
jgi:hypothetical protein